MKRKRWIYNVLFLVILGFVALGQTYPISPEELQVAHNVLMLETIVITLAYYTAMMLNIFRWVPRLLLRNRFLPYTLALLVSVLIIVGIEIVFELVLITHYGVSPEKYWYFSDDGILIFELIAPITAYFISIAGTALILILHLWKQSGAKIHDLEEQSARSELEEVRTRIDSEALFETLDRAALLVRQSPAAVSALLMELSKSLRVQLYESEQKRSTLSPQGVPGHTFNLSSPAVNFLTDKRYRLWHHLLLLAGFLLISIDNLDGTWASVLKLLGTAGVYLSLVYLNIYVFMPRWLMKNRIKTYVTAVALSLLIVIVPMQLVFYSDLFADYGNLSIWVHLSFTITNVVKLSFPILGVNAFLFFLYWVKNEKQIAELETATLLSELEQLQSQVNPHFLFNMLNNVIVLTKTNPGEAETVLHKLSDMLKYQFCSFTKRAILLEDDIRFLADYLNLEKLRRDNFEFTITVDDGVEALSLPPLLFIPFVENAVKHNNDNRNLSFVRLHFARENETLSFRCVNSKPLRPTRKDEVGGLGLPNVRRRLDLLYGNRYRLEITENNASYTVQLNIEFKNGKSYELYYC